MKNLLLIGGTGVLSRAVCAEALGRGFDVTMINRGTRAAEIPHGVRLIKSDKNNIDFIKSQLSTEKFDAVIDFLCYTKAELERSFKLYSNYTRQYFFISSCAVYHVTDGQVKYDETSPKCDPEWSYSIGKHESEKLLVQLAEKSECHYTIVRPAITYGDTRIPYGIAPPYGYHWTLVARILAEKPLIRWNKGTNFRNMMRVEDFATGIVGLIGNPMAEDEDFNVCGDESPTYNDIINIVEEYIGKKAVFLDISAEEYAQKIPYRRGEIIADRAKSAFFDNSKLKKAVSGWHQTIPLKEGVFRTLDAYRQQNYQQGIDWKFDGECDRIISEICKIKGISKSNYNIGFVDYLKEGLKEDKQKYNSAYKANLISIRGLKVLKKIVSKIRYHLYNKNG